MVIFQAKFQRIDIAACSSIYGPLHAWHTAGQACTFFESQVKNRAILHGL
jgi:hypothetical protein